MKIRTFLYTLTQGVRNLFRNGWYSLASIATIGACLFLFGLFYAVVANLQNILHTVEEGVSVQVFFEPEVSDMRIEEIGQQIAARVEVSKVVYHSDEEVWHDFGTKLFGENYREGFPNGENPLAGEHNYEVYLSDVSMQSSLVTWLNSFKGEVRKINQSEVTATTLSGINMIIAYISVGIIIILLAVSIFLISNTVRVGISVRAEEIGIMKYIGATDFFVRAPFVLEGILIGLLGALIPLYLIYELYDYVLTYMTERFSMLSSILNFLPLYDVFHVLWPICIGVGVGIGFLGSLFTVRKHLRV
ncbi:MAG: permease-like cell division protein FtsX [Lachnospiraceae bacterium]|nr:permease-like cell division protein FtsX [Lachnospiraceae bacterium]